MFGQPGNMNCTATPTGRLRRGATQFSMDCSVKSPVDVWDWDPLLPYCRDAQGRPADHDGPAQECRSSDMKGACLSNGRGFHGQDTWPTRFLSGFGGCAPRFFLGISGLRAANTILDRCLPRISALNDVQQRPPNLH